MKKGLTLFAIAWLLLTILLFYGCVKDSVRKTYSYTLYRPVYKTTAAVRENIKSNPSTSIQQTGKLFIKDNYIFLNELNKGVHVIDNRNPVQPVNVAFIDIPGNVDLAVKGNTLYADLYTDMVALDITNPAAVQLTKLIEGVFPDRLVNNYYGVDSSLVITDWIRKDTTVTEEYRTQNWKWQEQNGVVKNFDNAGGFALSAGALVPAFAAAPGTGGSMARFTLVNERLYTVGTQDLNVFNVAKASEPLYVTKKEIGFGIETIYPFKDKLFIGSTNGMFIYTVSNPDQPTQLSQFTHVQSCDPVIADADHAFVTLRSGTLCSGFANQLEVLDIANLLQPHVIKTYQMTHPQGLSKDGNLLFICDGPDGLKLYDAAKPDDLRLLKTIGGLDAYDVVAYNGLAIVVAKDGIYQFDYKDRNNVKQLSKITIN